MKISGFSFVRNGTKLYYPVRESIESILPICDEVVVAIGNCDEDDNSREEILSIGSDKIKIIDTVWDEKYMMRGAIHAIQTDIAMKSCTGDWLFYVQADEVVHEKDLPIIKQRCEQLLDNKEVEGLLFDYYHFWGDYERYHNSHGWYPNEIRIVRNLPQIHSWESAQSFRFFDYYDRPHQREGTRKLKVARANAHIYHYGWVRPPDLMQKKTKYITTNHKGSERAAQMFAELPKEIDYGPMDKLALFKGTHPAVMAERIKAMDWKDKLQKTGKPNKDRKPHKHELFKYKAVTFLENYLLFGKKLFNFKNYELLKY